MIKEANDIVYFDFKFYKNANRITISAYGLTKMTKIVSSTMPTPAMETTEDRLWHLSLALYHLLNYVVLPIAKKSVIKIHINNRKVRKAVQKILKSSEGELIRTTDKKFKDIITILTSQVIEVKTTWWLPRKLRKL